MRQYVIEFAKDCIKACKNSCRYDSAYRIDKIAKAYVNGYILNLDAMKAIIRIMEEE